ncbi:MAG: hypothetical protein HZC17_09965 [Candidatus Omnitrophica bacterium]|nr:hypothetical protein [Candidatus Omnitrophota bacterium]
MKKIISIFVAVIILCAPMAYAQSTDSSQPKKEGLIEELLHNFFHHEK